MGSRGDVDLFTNPPRNTLLRGFFDCLHHLGDLFRGLRHRHINDVVTIALGNPLYRKELDRLIKFLLKRGNWLVHCRNAMSGTGWTFTIFKTICI